MEEEKVKNDVKRVRDIMYAGRPKYLPLAILAGDLNIEVVDMPFDKFWAGTNSKDLIINKNFWERIAEDEKAFTIAHETAHYVSGDPEYVKSWNLVNFIWNIASDCVINREFVKDFNLPNIGKKIITPEALATEVRKLALRLGLPPHKIMGVGFFSSATKMEIYSYLKWLYDRGDAGVKGEIEKIWEKYGFPKDVKPSPYDISDAEERKERYKSLVDRLRETLKSAGREAGELLERIFGLGEPEIRWNEILEEVISELTSEYIATWKRPSRRHPEYPGHYRYGMPSVVVLIDVSGSITEDELGDFITELKSLMEDYGVESATVIFWSDTVKKVLEDIPPEDIDTVVETAKRIEGGGTVLHRAVRKALEYASDDRAMVVLTDGLLGDKPNEIRPLAERVPQLFYKVVYVYTIALERDKIPPTWVSVRYMKRPV